MAEAADAALYEMMSPTLLSKQPVTPPNRMARPDDNWGTFFSHFERRMGMLRNWRWSWWMHWNRLAEFFLPFRHIWVVVANRMTRGNPINDQIIDCSPQIAVRTCAAGLWTGLTSPSRPWFKIGLGLPWVKLDAPGKEWLEDTTERIMTVLHQSNFYDRMAQAFQDVTVFGTSPLIIYEDVEDVIRCYLPCVGEYFLAAGSRFSIDVLYREFTLTISQIVEMFTYDECPLEVQSRWQEGGGSIDMEMVVAHAIEPNFAVAPRGGRGDGQVWMVPKLFAYREVYWLRGKKTDKPLSRRGFRTKPFMAARWATVSNEAYGRSPCMDALGDTKQIQRETLRKGEYVEKGVRPPMLADVSLKNEPTSILPGMQTYVNTAAAMKGFQPAFEVSAAWMQPITADIDMVSRRIDRCLFVDLFMAISRMEGVQPRNELELTKRDLERLQELGPFIDLFESEFAGPAITRVMDILRRRNMLLPMPKSMLGLPLKIDYFSIMKLAQHASESVAMKDVFQTAGALSSAAKAAGVPDPIRTINLDKALRDYAEKNNFPEGDFFTEDEVAAHDAARQQATQATQAPGQAAAAVQAAKTLAETSMAPGSALSALTGGGQQ